MRKLIQKLRFRLKLRKMDDMWRMMCGNCWSLFPPSFYLIHSPEEIQRRKKKNWIGYKLCWKSLRNRTVFEQSRSIKH